MPKKIKFESFKSIFLRESKLLNYYHIYDKTFTWKEFIEEIRFKYLDGDFVIEWNKPRKNHLIFTNNLELYYRADRSEKNIGHIDYIKDKNRERILQVINSVAIASDFLLENSKLTDINMKERIFHDTWAKSNDSNLIDIIKINEVCTAPEIRFIVSRIGIFKNKKLLDIGCGLGEASIYFSLLGAEVTATDLSEEMVNSVRFLSKKYKVNVSAYVSSSESLNLRQNKQFDYIYMGNLLHHVDIQKTIERIKPHLASNGKFISWDPLAYNPIINIYRIIAKSVRTVDEHPLTAADLKFIKTSFKKVEFKYFWLTSLFIFILMIFVQFKNPNKIRLWKTVLDDGEKWKWLYLPLERFDAFLMRLFPFLKFLCWNVVIIASNE